jgi:hypothetical protein
LPLSLDGTLRRVTMEELIQAVVKRNVLDAEQAKHLRRIKENGDVIAHWAAKVDKAFMTALAKGDSEDVGTNPLQVYRDLRDAVSILTALARVVSEDPNLCGPGGLPQGAHRQV